MDLPAATEMIQAAAAAAAVVRLIYLNLAKRFPAFLAYLIFETVMSVYYGLLNQSSVQYFWSYLVLEPAECIFSIIAVRELFALTFDDYPGIRTVGRWMMYAGIVLALIVSLLLTGFFWDSAASGRAHSGIFYFEASKRSVVFALALVIIAILLVLSKYPLHLSRDSVVSSAFFGVLFLSEASRLLVDSLAPKLHNDYVDWAEDVFATICLVAWAAMLRHEPHKAPEPVRFSRPQEDQLLQQLNSLNQLMTRAARR